MKVSIKNGKCSCNVDSYTKSSRDRGVAFWTKNFKASDDIKWPPLIMGQWVSTKSVSEDDLVDLHGKVAIVTGGK